MIEMADKTYASFDEFWPDYVRAHTNKTNRQLHFVGLTLAVACVAGAAISRKRWLLLAAPVCGYGFAWFGHFVFEKNKPATFSHPLYSFKADWVMWSKIAGGTMDAEVEKYTAEVAPPPVDVHAANGSVATNGVADVTTN